MQLVHFQGEQHFLKIALYSAANILKMSLSSLSNFGPSVAALAYLYGHGRIDRLLSFALLLSEASIHRQHWGPEGSWRRDVVGWTVEVPNRNNLELN